MDNDRFHIRVFFLPSSRETIHGSKCMIFHPTHTRRQMPKYTPVRINTAWAGQFLARFMYSAQIATEDDTSVQCPDQSDQSLTGHKGISKNAKTSGQLRQKPTDLPTIVHPPTPRPATSRFAAATLLPLSAVDQKKKKKRKEARINPGFGNSGGCPRHKSNFCGCREALGRPGRKIQGLLPAAREPRTLIPGRGRKEEKTKRGGLAERRTKANNEVWGGGLISGEWVEEEENDGGKYFGRGVRRGPGEDWFDMPLRLSRGVDVLVDR